MAAAIKIIVITRSNRWMARAHGGVAHGFIAALCTCSTIVIITAYALLAVNSNYPFLINATTHINLIDAHCMLQQCSTLSLSL